MQDFRPFWKQKAQDKQLTFIDCIQRCILIGMHKGQTFEDKVDIALTCLDRSFSPKACGGYGRLQQELRYAGQSHYGIASKLDMTDEEKKLFERIGTELRSTESLKKLGTHYSYIFTFGNLIPEQVVVQGMHAAMALGSKLTEAKTWPNGCNASNLHYVLIDGNLAFGPNTMAHQIADFLGKQGISFSTYRDHDYWFDDNGSLCESKETSVKSIMTHPIPRWRRSGFEQFELLRFEPVGPEQQSV